ncbi:MAG: SHOCT domain-containing protein [Candidatus Anammoxibacter sp.]
MKKITAITWVFPVLFCFLTSSAIASPKKLKTDDKRPCAQNFTYEGNFFSGYQFKTHQFVNNVSIDAAVTRVAKSLADEGYSINNVNKEMGIVSASQVVSFGSGKTVPFNANIASANAGVNVSLTFSISGGLITYKSKVKEMFCRVIESISVNQNQNKAPSKDSIGQRLVRLKKLRDKDLITEDEYKERKYDILEGL